MTTARYATAVRALVALLLVGTLAPAGALGVEQTVPAQDVSVAVVHPAPSTPADGTFRAEVAVTLAAPAEYLEVRVRLKGGSGNLIYQKTEVRSNVSAGRIAVPYEHDLSRLGLAPGRYPLEVRVLATGAEPTVLDDRLLLTGPDQPIVPVAVVVRVAETPMTAADGRMLADPATHTRLRDGLVYLAGLASSRNQPLALALPPVLLEDLSRVAAGYETTGGVTVAADAQTPLAYASALADMRRAVSAGALELLGVPYALPDVPGLASIGASGDLEAHWARGVAVTEAALGARPATETVSLGDALTPAALTSAAAYGARTVIAGPSSLASPGDGVPPGVYRVPGADIPIVVAASDVASAAASSEPAFYDALFAHRDANGLVLVFDVGPGSASTLNDVAHALDWIGRTSWTRVAALDDAIGGIPLAAGLAASASPAPDGYWDAVADARDAAYAYALAVGDADAGADSARRAVLVAESALWSGADGGRAFAAEATAFVAERFALVRVDAKDVTLSGRRGELPFTVVNGTGVPLTVTVTATPARGGEQPSVRIVELEPADNYLTLPVDLGQALGDEYTITVGSGDLTLAGVVVEVGASYIDRLAIVGMVVVVLIGLLVYIRRRVVGAEAGTLADGAGTIEADGTGHRRPGTKDL